MGDHKATRLPIVYTLSLKKAHSIKASAKIRAILLLSLRFRRIKA